MRFRVPNTGGQQAADGVGSFFRALAMAPMAEAQAADAARQAQAKESLIGAQTEQARANSRFNNAKADQEADLTQRRGLGGMIGDAAMANGVAPYQVPDFIKFAQTGQMPSKYQPPPVDGVGSYEPAPAIYQDDTVSKIWKMLGLNNQTLAFDRGNVEDVAKATGAYQDQGAMGDALTAANGGDYMKSSALSAVRGKKEFTPFKAVGNTGTALNEITGEQPVTNQGMNVLFGDEGRALVSQRQAAAGASGAAAGASRALASLRGTQTTNEKIKGGLSALDFQAAQEGKPLPSSNKGTSGSSATNSKFRNQIILAAMRKPEFSVMNQAEKSDYINTELMVAGMDPIVPGELAGLPVQGNPQAQAKGPGPIDAKAAGSTAGAAAKKQPDMTKAAAVKADYKAGKLTKEQARAKLQQLGFE